VNAVGCCENLLDETKRRRRGFEPIVGAETMRRTMDRGKLEAPEPSDHELFRESIAELDRIVRGSFRTTVVQITAAIAAIAAPLILGGIAGKAHVSIADIVYASLFLILALQIRDLFRHGRTALVRERLSKQLKAAVVQRIRANRLYDLSILDPLTGLHNRRFGEQRLEEELARSERNGDPLAVLLFDLDYFKEINDQFGHAAGDGALKEFSRRLKRAIRACDVPVRIGGDEFLVILPECPREKVDKILARIGMPEIRLNDQVISIRYSVGRAHHQVCDTTESMLHRADQVLYAEKASRPPKNGTTSQAPEIKPHRALVYNGPPSFHLKRFPES
jgi:diguanylate cyclase (GGDEF)-like protein